MPRTLTGTLDNAIDAAGSYKFKARATVYPSNVFISAIDDDFAVTGADAQGAVNDPMAQDIEYSSTVGGLVTWYCDGSLKYAVQGNSSPVTTVYTSSVKPGVNSGKLFLFDGTNVKRYAINYSTVAALGTDPLTEEVTLVPSLTPLAIHAISATEAVLICQNDGGYSIIYLNGVTEKVSTSRFMFPKIVDWDESSRTLGDMAKFSAGAKLGNDVFAYMSAAYSGVVHGIKYDAQVGTWSDIFTAMPTDKSVSMCEFRVSNAFTRNSKIYLCGMLNRTDAYAGSQPYTLLMGSPDGKTFSIDRFSLITNLGYRFLAHVGTDNYLYVGNCNRVSKKLSTWVFDGDTFTTSPKTALGMDKIVAISASDLQSLNVELKGGEEEFVDHAHIKEGSRLVLEAGYNTTAGDEYVEYGTYIISQVTHSRTNTRSLQIQCIHEGRWRMSGLSMPFYAEMTGISSTYDSMNEEEGILYSAPSSAKYRYNFWVDFWQNEPYVNATESITGIPAQSGGQDMWQLGGSHKAGLVIDGDVASIAGFSDNPTITATTIDTKIYGWGYPVSSGNQNDSINLIVIHTDEDGEDEQTIITTEVGKKWPVEGYNGTKAGDAPIEIQLTGLTVGRKIKKVGLVAECTTATKFYPWRVEFTNGVKVPITLPETGVTWEKQDNGTFKIPGTGQPFVQFSQKPYNAFNFSLSAKFTNSVTGGVAGYPVAVGLVGLGKDAGNFVSARFDKVSGKAQLVNVKETLETILSEQTPAFSVGDEVSMHFTHRDGNFKLWIYDTAAGVFKTVIDYDWKAADGFMCASVVQSLKCGMYGAIEGPMAQIVSFSHADTENGSYADGIPIAPMEDITDFPASGNLRIGTNVYSYTSKIPHPTYVRGPSQLRAMGVYSAPYGNGKSGLQCRDHDWNGGQNLDGYFIATDIGSVFLIDGPSKWDPFITTSGAVVKLPGRSQHYSANKKIANFPASSATRIFVVGGFDGVSFVSGTPGTHRLRDYARLELEGTITCHWFMGAGGETDQTTVQDLVEKICNLSGVGSSFPGNVETASIAVTSSETELVNDQYAEGFDISFEISTATSFEMRTNVKIVPDNYEEKTLIEADTGSTVSIVDNGSGSFTLSILSTPSNTVMFKMNYSSGTGYQKFRIMYHENSCSVFQNGKWVTTITFDELDYTQTDYVVVNGYHATSVDFLNVVVKELSELREAVYIDLETDGNAALSGVIQERPIEILPLPDGSLQVYYIYTLPSSTLALAPVSHNITYEIPQEAASDGIVYGSKDVKTLQFAPFTGILGLSTKLFRFPNLNIGAREAAVRTLKKLYERRKMTQIECRPQLAPLTGEKLAISYTLGGLGKAVSDTIIIESTSLEFSNQREVSVRMSITGRDYYAV